MYILNILQQVLSKLYAILYVFYFLGYVTLFSCKSENTFSSNFSKDTFFKLFCNYL